MLSYIQRSPVAAIWGPDPVVHGNVLLSNPLNYFSAAGSLELKKDRRPQIWDS